MIDKRYPIQDGPSVPWSYMMPHDAVARRNHGGQSLEHLAARGGLGSAEAELVVTGQKLYPEKGEWNWDELKWRWYERAEKVNCAWLASRSEVMMPTPDGPPDPKWISGPTEWERIQAIAFGSPGWDTERADDSAVVQALRRLRQQCNKPQAG